MAEVRPATSKSEIREALAFREAILAGDDPRASAPRDEHDDDPTTVHCFVRDDDGTCLGAGRLVAPIDSEHEGHLVDGNPVIGPIVVAPHARRSGIGRAILGFLEQEALSLYGSNGVVQVEAWVPSWIAEGVESAGYTVREEDAGAGLSATRVFRDVSIADQSDSREGPTAA
jgi:GNAT superfamily N-acetyltransferase